MVVHGFDIILWGVIAAALGFVVIRLIVVRGLVTTIGHGGHNNSVNNGINGNGSNNVVNSGNNFGHHMFSNAFYSNISGGEFINSGRDTTKNICKILLSS
ncbi:hypothetical protein JOM56_009023 [Amanita muscaria]